MDGGALKRATEDHSHGRNSGGHAAPSLRLLQYSGQTPPVTEPRVPEKRSVGGCGAGSWGSGSQQEACSWPRRPQEGWRRVKVAVKV